MIIKGYALILMGIHFRFLIHPETDGEFRGAAVAMLMWLPILGRVFDLW